MTTWSHGTCTTNGVRLHFLRTGGDGSSVLLLHGLMGSGACWTFLARALAPEHDVVMPDLRGHGASSAPESGYRYDDLASDVEGLIAELALDRPVLVGHSMGGMTAALIASRQRVDLRGLVLVDPTFLSPERQQEVHASDVAGQHRKAIALGKEGLIAQARTRSPRRALELVAIQAEARLATSLAAFDILVPPNPDYREVVGAIRVPSLLVVGDDPVVTPTMASELTAMNHRLRTETIANAGHGLPFEQPERLAEVVSAFLRAGT